MKITSVFLVFSTIFFASCEKETVVMKAPQLIKTDAEADVPLLPVTEGDSWTYEVRFVIPEGAAAPGSGEIDSSHERTRRYIGKISPREDLPEVDCFELEVPGSPILRELLEIRDDKILLRGTSSVDQGSETRVTWHEDPFPFVTAGVMPGSSYATRADGMGNRIEVRIVAREETAVPAGRFPSIRILMTGQESGIEFHRTIWFAPGIGIVREEKTRYSQDKLLVRETHELLATSMKLGRGR